MKTDTTITTILPLTHEMKLKKSLPLGSRTLPVVVKWWPSGVCSGSEVVVCRAKLTECEVVVKRRKNSIFGFEGVTDNASLVSTLRQTSSGEWSRTQTAKYTTQNRL